MSSLYGGTLVGAPALAKRYLHRGYMAQIYLFDWSDTLMVEFPDSSGKMCGWPKVQAVTGALETLQTLSKSHPIYVATNAADSSEFDIKLAFERVGLSDYITGYFCRSNLGLSKDSPEFYKRIVLQLGVEANQVTMVGDTYDKDIQPAIEAGLNAIWFHKEDESQIDCASLVQIQSLRELCI